MDAEALKAEMMMMRLDAEALKAEILDAVRSRTEMASLPARGLLLKHMLVTYLHMSLTIRPYACQC